MLLAKVDELGRTAWLVVTLLSFWVFWPLGLAVLAFLAGSGRLRAWRSDGDRLPGRWFNLRSDRPGKGGPWGWGTASSGNQAFDAYREETLRRLDEERQEFQAFLDRLRRARDKAEFDEFMTERRRSRGMVDPAGGPDGNGAP